MRLLVTWRDQYLEVPPEAPDEPVQGRLFEASNEAYERDLDGLVADWRTQGRSEGTLYRYVRQLVMFGERYDELTLKTARAFVEETRRRSQSSGRYAGRALRSFDTWRAREYNRVPVLRNLRLPANPQPVNIGVANPDDVEAMLLRCPDNFMGIRDRAMIHVFRSTGMRRCEVAAMSVGERQPGERPDPGPEVEGEPAESHPARQQGASGSRPLLADARRRHAARMGVEVRAGADQYAAGRPSHP